MIVIQSPNSGATFTAPANVTASGTGGPVTAWRLLESGTQVRSGGAVAGANWSFPMNNLTVGSYELFVTGEKKDETSVDFSVVAVRP